MKRAINKVVVITGGNSGIGKGIAKKFSEEGANIVIFGRNQKTLDSTKKELGKNILTIQGDVQNTNDLKNLFTKTQSHFGKIDVLIANSGVSKQIPLEKVTESDFDFMTNINYRALFFTVKYGIDFLNDSAAIILIASVAAHTTVKGHSIYSSNKAAVLKLAKNLAFDLADKNIRVNSISPGYIRTPIFDERIKKDPDYLKSRSTYIPLKRIGTPEDIGNAALFLASEEASYITGADLIIDGGYSTSYPLPD